MTRVKHGRTRGDAVGVLTQAGWTPQEIAYVLRWKVTAVEQVLKYDNPARWGRPLMDDDGMAIS
jgi:hypothetical protein